MPSSAFASVPDKLGEDQSYDNLPQSSVHFLSIRIRLSRLEPQFAQIPVESFLSETTDTDLPDFISDDDSRVIVRSAINATVSAMLAADEFGTYDAVAKDSINDYLDMCIQGTSHLRGMFYEIRSQASPLQVSVGYHRIANTLVSRAMGGTVFHFDFTKAASHQNDREIFEMYRGIYKDDGNSSLSTPRHVFGGSRSVLSDVESIMITDDNDPKGTRVLSPRERQLDAVLKRHDLSFSGPTKMPKDIDVVVEDVNEDKSSSDDSVESILPPIKKPVKSRRFGNLFPQAVAQAIAGAADGMTSAFSKGPPPSMFSKGPPSSATENYGKKIRDMHSPVDPHTPTDSCNFASRREQHQKSKANNRASFHVPGHDSSNFDTPDYTGTTSSAPNFTNQSQGNYNGGNNRHSNGGTGTQSGTAPSGSNKNPPGSNHPSGTSHGRRTSTSAGFVHNSNMGNAAPRRPAQVPFSGIRHGANVSFPKQLYCEDGESDNTRWANLVKLADKDIPQTRHRNGSTLKDTEKFDTELPCMSVRRFINRCAMNGIYVPPLSAFTEESCMGREYECDVLPTKIYEDIPLMRRSGKEDLMHITQNDATLASIVTSSPDMYIGLHNILRLQVHVFRGEMAPTSMTQYKSGVSIVRHVERSQEYIIQSSITGHSFTKYGQYRVMTQGLPRFLRNACDDEAITMIRRHGCDEFDNVPNMLELCNVATFILSVISKRGMVFPPKSTVRFNSQHLSKDVMHIDADVGSKPDDGLDDQVFAQLLAFQRRQRTCFGCNQPGHTISDCPEFEITRKSSSGATSQKKPFGKPSHSNKSVNAMLSSPGEETCDSNNGESDAIDADDTDIFKSDINLDKKVASVIRQESLPSSEASSLNDFDMHRDGFAYGDFDDYDHRVAAVSADFSISIDDDSESSSVFDNEITLDTYVDRSLGLLTTVGMFHEDGMDSTLEDLDSQSDDVWSSAFRFIANGPGIHTDGVQRQDYPDRVRFAMRIGSEDSDDDSTDSSIGMPSLVTRHHGDSSSDDDTWLSSSDDNTFRDELSFDLSHAPPSVPNLFPAQDRLRVDPDDEIFLSDFMELLPDRAMIDQLILTLGQRSTTLVSRSPDTFHQDDEFIESHRRMNLLLRFVAITDLSSNDIYAELPAISVSPNDLNEVGIIDDDGYHLPPLEVVRMTRDTDFIDAIDAEMNRLSLDHSPLFLSSVEAENDARNRNIANWRTVLHALGTNSPDPDDESLSEEDIPSVNVMMTRDG